MAVRSDRKGERKSGREEGVIEFYHFSRLPGTSAAASACARNNSPQSEV